MIITSLMLSVAIVTGCARHATVDDEQEQILQQDKLMTEENAGETKTVSEPFYNSQKIILEAPLPVNESGIEGDYLGCGEPIIAGDHILVHMYYSFSEPDNLYPSWDWSRWCVFDFEGNYVTFLQEDFMDEVVTFDEDAHGRITAAYADYDYSDNNWTARVNLTRFDQNGQLLAGPVNVFSDNFYSNLSLAVNDETGEILVASEHKIMHLNENFEVMLDNSYSNEISIKALWEDQGKFYMETETMGENFQVQASIYNVTIARNGYLAVDDTSRDSTNLYSMRLCQTNTGIYAATRNALGKLDLSSGEFSSLLDWNQTDIDRSLILYGQLKVLSEGSCSSGVRVIDPEGPASSVSSTPDAPRNDYSDDESALTRIAIASYDYIGDSLKPCLYLLTPSDKNPHEGQDILWVGGIGITGSALMSGIARFNSSNSKNIWVKVYDYAGFDYIDPELSPVATQKALQRMAAQLNSGTGPDIMIGGGETGLFDNGSMLTDLNGYVDGISGIDRNDYFNSVLESFETTGKLYQIPLVFSVRGLVGNKNMVNGKTEMNYADLIEARNCLDEYSDLFSEISVEELCNIFIEGETGTWIDYSNSSVMIDHDQLVDMLELLKNEITFGMNGFIDIEASPDDITFDPVERGSYRDIFANRSVFAPSTMNTIGEYAQTKMLPGAFSWYGYPGSKGSSMIIQSDISVGISASSTQKEKAWEVIKFFLEDEEQLEMIRPGALKDYRSTSFIPLNKDAFREANSEEMFGSEIFAYVTDVDGYGIECYAGEREELLKEYEAALNAPMRRYIRDPEIIRIVKEFVGKYICGESSAEESAYEIEKKITEYFER